MFCTWLKKNLMPVNNFIMISKMVSNIKYFFLVSILNFLYSEKSVGHIKVLSGCDRSEVHSVQDENFLHSQ